MAGLLSIRATDPETGSPKCFFARWQKDLHPQLDTLQNNAPPSWEDITQWQPESLDIFVRNFFIALGKARADNKIFKNSFITQPERYAPLIVQLNEQELNALLQYKDAKLERISLNRSSVVYKNIVETGYIATAIAAIVILATCVLAPISGNAVFAIALLSVLLLPLVPLGVFLFAEGTVGDVSTAMEANKSNLFNAISNILSLDKIAQLIQSPQSKTQPSPVGSKQKTQQQNLGPSAEKEVVYSRKSSGSLAKAAEASKEPAAVSAQAPRPAAKGATTQPAC